MWRVWSKQSDIYLAHADRGNIEKLSFHRSGICRRAFTTEYGTPVTLPDRLMQRWMRTPGQMPGSENFHYAAVLAFPTDFLSTTLEPTTKKQMSWITPGPEHMTSFLELFFTREKIEVVETFCASAGRTLIGYTELPSGEIFVMSGHVEQWPGQEMVIPASHGSAQDIVVSPSDPDGTGRPVRLTMFNDAKPTSPFTIVEYGAYQVAAGVGWREGMGTLTRNAVIERSAGSTL
jgi:hypothetical protein